MIEKFQQYVDQKWEELLKWKDNGIKKLQKPNDRKSHWALINTKHL